MTIHAPIGEALRLVPGAACVPDIVAILHVFNEELILEAVLAHLAEQEIGFFILDNWSTDASVEIAGAFAGRGLIGLQRIPDPRPTETERIYDLPSMLRRKSALAVELAGRGARWVMHYDADEIRESPWPGVSLRDGLQRVAAEGYNAVDHALVNFVPTDENFSRGMSPQAHFQFYLPEERPRSHGKAWRQGGTPVDLVRHGGHFVRFSGRKIYPIPFVIRHYPLLSSAHARRKILRERMPRYSEAGLALGWHRHYLDSREHSSFVYAPDDPRLKRWDEAAFKRELQARAPSRRGWRAWWKSRAPEPFAAPGRAADRGR